MTTREDWQDPWTAGRQPHDRAYYLHLLGDGNHGLGRHEAAIEAYQQAAEAFRAQGAECSHALCLFKIADSHLSLGEPWHAVGYLEACLPLLHDLGLTRYESFARERLEACRCELAATSLLGEGAGRPAAGADPAVPSRRSQPAGTLSPRQRDRGTFLSCPGPTRSRDG